MKRTTRIVTPDCIASRTAPGGTNGTTWSYTFRAEEGSIQQVGLDGFFEILHESATGHRSTEPPPARAAPKP